MKKEITENTIAKILAGETSPQDIIALSSWLEENEANIETFLQIKKYWEANVQIAEQIAYPEILDKILSRAKSNHDTTKKKIALFMMVASLIFAIAFLAIFNPNEKHFYNYLASNNISKFDLIDGSAITLNKNSSLSYDENFGKKERRVQLKGEAYFEVAKNPDKHFIVSLGDANIRVLGTTFNAKLDMEEEITISLIEGKVRFEIFDQYYDLNANEKLCYNQRSKQMNITQMADGEAGIVSAWRKNLFRYKSATFPEIANMLENQYNINIKIVDDTLKNNKLRLTGAFDTSLDPEEILNLLKTNIDIEWTKSNDTYNISKAK